MKMPEKTEPTGIEHETFIRAYTANEGRVKAFLRTLLPDWDSVDEAFQEASIVMWQKWAHLDSPENFFPWACTIARLKALHIRRKHGRDRLVFAEELVELLAEESACDTLEGHQIEIQALDKCMSELKSIQRQLILGAYRDKGSIKEMAEVEGTSPTRLYKVLARLKTRLQDCVELKIASVAS
ncbi:sigma-70 family RNA polymerase sigma factor [Verrucomicrobia bacterium]|nr:sigma-70 family RNA polymerase sigma factor [Verrucomicrobiota bacterium]